MSAKFVDLRCPNCGGKIDVKDGQKILYCPYCGAQLFFDDGVKRSEKTVNVNKTIKNVYRDESQIETEKQKSNRFELLIGLILVIALWIFLPIGFH